ncbi:MAG: hypothetical protein CSA18_03330 [Deltaproteobacteria bacterium]|nr:MAG: hypothetical protein CSA18_03330 [Deltaproteobacteria bacterium]
MKKIFVKKYFVFILFFFMPAFCFAKNAYVPDHYKGTKFTYDGLGLIHLIGEKRFVIGDINYRKSPKIEYHGLKLRYLSSSEFSVGDFVGLKINSKREITDLYLIKKRKDLKK